MTTAVWIGVLLINLLLGIRSKKNYKIIILISAILIILLLGGNYQNADFAGYERFYNAQVYPPSMEFGYVFLSSVMHSMGLPYQSFVTVLMSIAIIVSGIVVIRYKSNVHLVIFIYAATLLFLDAVQIRQMLAYSFFLLALMLLADKKKIFGAASIILAALFQWSAIAFIPLVFLNPERRLNKKAIRVIVAIILAACLLVFANGNSLSFLMPIFRLFVNSDKLLYFDTKTRFGFILYFAFQFACMYVSYIGKETLKKYCPDEKVIKFANYVYMATLYASIAMPLVMTNNNFARFFKYSMLGCLIIISKVVQIMRQSDIKVKMGKKYVGSPSTYGIIVAGYLIVYEIVIQLSSVVTDVLSFNVYF